jgi:hypothetical protein
MRQAKAMKTGYRWQDDPMYAGCEEPAAAIRSVDDVSLADRSWAAWSFDATAQREARERAAMQQSKPASKVARMWGRNFWTR